MQFASARHNSSVSDERRRSYDGERISGLRPLVGTLQIQTISETNLFALYIRVSRLSGDFGPSHGAVASLWRRYAGLGEAIWRDLSRH